MAAAPRRRRAHLREELETRFSTARFPFRHDRHVPALIVRGTAGTSSLDPTFRSDAPWPESLKRELVDRGYALTDEALAQSAFTDSGSGRADDSTRPRSGRL